MGDWLCSANTQSQRNDGPKYSMRTATIKKSSTAWAMRWFHLIRRPMQRQLNQFTFVCIDSSLWLIPVFFRGLSRHGDLETIRYCDMLDQTHVIYLIYHLCIQWCDYWLSGHYLSFQHHLIVVLGIITLISIVIILPINFTGTLSGDVNSFSHTTIANLDPSSPLIWIHTTFAILFVPLVVLIMRRSSGRNAFKIAPTRTVIMTEISKPDCNRNSIQNYLQQIFPDVEIRDVQLAYNIKKLTEVAKEYGKINIAKYL